MKHPYMEVYPFKISDNQRLVFCEDMHMCKVLSYNDNFNAVLFGNKESADFTCNLINSLKIEGLSVYVVGEPYRIHLNKRPNRVTTKPTFEHKTRDLEFEITHKAYGFFVENDIAELVDYMAAALHVIHKRDVKDSYIDVLIKKGPNNGCSVIYNDSKGKEIYNEGFSHIEFNLEQEQQLVYSETVLMLKSEYEWELP